ncbi:MAG TPA: hypothetical protein V6D46_01805 [Coleofasciculaceae cyanobacterium]
MMEQHHEARQAAQQAFLEALERLRENLIDGEGAAPSEPEKITPIAPRSISSSAESGITLDDLEAAIEDIDRYMHIYADDDDDAAEDAAPAAPAVDEPNPSPSLSEPDRGDRVEPIPPTAPSTPHH